MRGPAFPVLLLCACAVFPLLAGEVVLQTELKVSGPTVSISAPLGLRYRPGALFPLQVRVHNPGLAFRGELFLTEGGPGRRCGFFDGVDFPENTTRVFTLPVRAPTVAANLELVIRELHGGPLRFQAALARVLKPLAPEARIILSCGTQAPLSFGPQEEVVQLSAREFPAELWWYENVDLVVLGDGSFRGASQNARQALRLWLLGGGRLLITSQDDLSTAIAAELLPLDAQAHSGLVGAERSWWEEHAGLKAGGILAQKNNRPVYIALQLGFGEIVLLFPATGTEDAREFGAGVVNHPLLRRVRDKLPDLRVQPDRFAAFALGAASPALRSAAARWMLLGAIAFCIGLALACTSRSRLVAAGWPLVVAALLGVLLARWFPERALAVSRFELVSLPADSQAVLTKEWALAEAFNEPAAIAVRGLATPLYADTAELRSTQAEVSLDGPQPRLQTVVPPDRPALFTAAQTVSVGESESFRAAFPRGQLRCRGQNLTVVLPGAREWSGTRFHDAVWVRPDGSLYWLKQVDAQGSFDLGSYEDGFSNLRKAWAAGYAGTLGKAHAAALAWAAGAVKQSRRETVLFWEQLPGEHGVVIEFEPPAPNTGELFRILAVQTAKE